MYMRLLRLFTTCAALAALLCGSLLYAHLIAVPRHLSCFDVPEPRRHCKHSAIVVLVPSIWDDIKQLSMLLGELDCYLDDGMCQRVLLFHDEPLDDQMRGALRSATRRQLTFQHLVFTFPPGFDPATARTSTFKKRGTWNYAHMIRFFVHTLHTHPQLRDLETYIRFDTDSCLRGRVDLMDVWARRKLIYRGNHFLKDDYEFVRELPETVDVLVRNASRVPTHPWLYRNWCGEGRTYACLGIYNNLEMASLHFFTRPDVRHFVDGLDRAHGMYTHRWGDAIIRLATLAIFAPVRSFTVVNTLGYVHPADSDALCKARRAMRGDVEWRPQIVPSWHQCSVRACSGPSALKYLFEWMRSTVLAGDLELMYLVITKTWHSWPWHAPAQSAPVATTHPQAHGKLATADKGGGGARHPLHAWQNGTGVSGKAENGTRA